MMSVVHLQILFILLYLICSNLDRFPSNLEHVFRTDVIHIEGKGVATESSDVDLLDD